MITCCLSSVCPCTKQASSDCVDFKSLRSNNTFKFRYAFISTKFMKKFVSIDIFFCSEFVIVLLEPYVALEKDKVKHAG